MQYNMTEPCDECPFLIGSGFSYRNLLRYSSGEFACHKACKLDHKEEGSFYVPRNEKTPHCAGALIFLEKQEAPHQMMRIRERLGMYDRTQLNINAPIVNSPDDCRKPHYQTKEHYE